MSGRTPLPWALNEDGTVVVDRNHRLVIAEVGSSFSGESEANAAFIVQAVNAHDALLDLVRMLRDRLDEEEMGEQTGNHVAIWEAIHEGARAAIEALENLTPHKDALT